MKARPLTMNNYKFTIHIAVFVDVASYNFTDKCQNSDEPAAVFSWQRRWEK
jgi:hypothetical protein